MPPAPAASVTTPAEAGMPAGVRPASPATWASPRPPLRLRSRTAGPANCRRAYRPVWRAAVRGLGVSTAQAEHANRGARALTSYDDPPRGIFPGGQHEQELGLGGIRDAPGQVAGQDAGAGQGRFGTDDPPLDCPQQLVRPRLAAFPQEVLPAGFSPNLLPVPRQGELRAERDRILERQPGLGQACPEGFARGVFPLPNVQVLAWVDGRHYLSLTKTQGGRLSPRERSPSQFGSVRRGK
jgi:hypothetical protein